VRRGASGSHGTAWCPVTRLIFAPKFDTFWIMDSGGLIGRQARAGQAGVNPG